MFKKILTNFFLLTALFILTACSAKDGDSLSKDSNIIQDNKKTSSLTPPPPWTQTEYVFQNKTDNQISILADQGRGKGVSKVILNSGKCIYIEYLPFSFVYAKLTKAGKGLICNHCPYDKSCEYAQCSDKLAPVYQNFERDPDSQLPYLEVYNIVDTDQILTAGSDEPVQASEEQKNLWKEKGPPSPPSSLPNKQ